MTTPKKILIAVASFVAIAALVLLGKFRSNSELKSVQKLPHLFSAETNAATTDSAKGSLVHFWASWCGPCREELPSLMKNIGRSSKTYNVYLVSIDDDISKAKLFLAELGVKPEEFPHFYSDVRSDVSRAFGTSKIPETYFYSKDGRLIRKVGGPMDWDSPKSQSILSTAN